jgi:hypothetical protein
MIFLKGRVSLDAESEKEAGCVPDDRRTGANLKARWLMNLTAIGIGKGKRR